jgi:hypothetical protein
LIVSALCAFFLCGGALLVLLKRQALMEGPAGQWIARLRGKHGEEGAAPATSDA